MVPVKFNTIKTTPKSTIGKSPSLKIKQILKAAREKKQITCKGIQIGLQTYQQKSYRPKKNEM